MLRLSFIICLLSASTVHAQSAVTETFDCLTGSDLNKSEVTECLEPIDAAGQNAWDNEPLLTQLTIQIIGQRQKIVEASKGALERSLAKYDDSMNVSCVNFQITSKNASIELASSRCIFNAELFKLLDYFDAS